MLNPTYEQLSPFLERYKVIPISRTIYADIITPINLLRKLAAHSHCYYLLESVEGGEKWGRYSFLGYDPTIRFTSKDSHITIARDGAETEAFDGNPYDAIRSILKDYSSPRLEGLPPFTGGLVSYFSYESIQYAEPKLKLKKSDTYDMELMLFDKIIAYDHLQQKIYLIANMQTAEGEAGLQKAYRALAEIETLILDTMPLPEEQAPENVTFSCNVTKEQYCAMVEKTKEYIRQGDIFQAVISRKFEAPYPASLFSAYRVLRTTNPSPYMYFLHGDDIEIAGTSPETLVKLTDGTLYTYPIAGSRPRGTTEEEDLRLEAELLQDEKELAEHNMLVDLARNDLGKISAFGSVGVKEYMKINRFSRIMHITSTVESQIRPPFDACDTIAALLPAGTLSGAPKIRACEIIDELEPSPRGIYGGAIGYIDFSGNLDTCITIRTAVKRGGTVTVQAGGGIVADSIPEMEYMESENKSLAAKVAIQTASEVVRK